MQSKKIAIIGSVGVPANYGGFETLAENLAKYHKATLRSEVLTIYCSSHSYPVKNISYLSAHLKYIPLNANGIQSIPYDIYSLFSALWNKNDVILLLGVSGALALPFIRIISPVRIITNIDGIEWRRQKWRGLAKWFLQLSERIAISFSHDVIADNAAIAEYIHSTYGTNSHVIAYGGDHVQRVSPVPVDEYNLPQQYAFSVCRIEPENNIEMIVEAFSQNAMQPLVMVGNWGNSEYGKSIQARFKKYSHLFLLNPIYDHGKLHSLHAQSEIYVHGHSAGGTNPSLVEAMHFGKIIWAFDCSYNRETTENKALYFNSVKQLIKLIIGYDHKMAEKVGQDMLQIASKSYVWDKIAKQYFSLISH